MKHEEARDILEKAGAWVDGERVRLPSYMVKARCARKAPASRCGPVTAIEAQHPHRSRTCALRPRVRHVLTSSIRRRSSAASTRRRMCRWSRGSWTPCPTSTSASHWARWMTFTYDLEALYELRACSQHQQTDRCLVVRQVRLRGIHEIAVAEAGGQRALSSGPLMSTIASLSRRLSALSRRLTSSSLRPLTECPWSSRPAPLRGYCPDHWCGPSSPWALAESGWV